MANEKFKLKYLTHLLNSEKIRNLSNRFYDSNFELIINETNLPYWTSDAPVVITENSDVYYPISNKYLVFLNKIESSIGKHYRKVNEKSEIEIANLLQCYSSNQFVLACDMSLNSLIEENC